MKTKNKYIYRSKLSEAKFREIVKYFSLDIEANKAAVLSSLNRNTLNRYYLMIRKSIAEYCEIQCCKHKDISINYYKDNKDDNRQKCIVLKSGSMVFGMRLMNGTIYTEIINENEIPGGKTVLLTKQDIDYFISSCRNNRWRSYRAVADYAGGRYIRISNDFIDIKEDKDGKVCDLFWGYVKNRLMKFNGVSKKTLYFHIKECEFRFNNRNENLYKLLLKIIRENPLT